MTMRTGLLLAGEALGIQRFAGDVEARRQKALCLFGAETLIAEQILMLGDPEDFLGREMLPAVRAGHAVQQAASPTLSVRADHTQWLSYLLGQPAAYLPAISAISS